MATRRLDLILVDLQMSSGTLQSCEAYRDRLETLRLRCLNAVEVSDCTERRQEEMWCAHEQACKFVRYLEESINETRPLTISSKEDIPKVILDIYDDLESCLKCIV